MFAIREPHIWPLGDELHTFDLNHCVDRIRHGRVDLECVLGLCVYRWGCCGQLKRAFPYDTAPKSIPLIKIKEPTYVH